MHTINNLKWPWTGHMTERQGLGVSTHSPTGHHEVQCGSEKALNSPVAQKCPELTFNLPLKSNGKGREERRVQKGQKEEAGKSERDDERGIQEAV